MGRFAGAAPKIIAPSILERVKFECGRFDLIRETDVTCMNLKRTCTGAKAGGSGVSLLSVVCG